MSLNVLSVDEITKRLMPVFETSGVTKAVLFGSYAKGFATEHSDIDIMVETESWVRGLNFVGIIGEIAENLNIEVDLIAKRSIKPESHIAMEIEKDGMVIYDRQG